MRKDFSCFRDGAVTTLSVAEPGSSADRLDRSLQAATACVYRVALASRKDLLVTVTWTRRSVVTTSVADAAAAGATGLSVAVEEVQAEVSNNLKLLPSSAAVTPAATPCRSAVKPAAAASAQQRVVHLMHKRRGSRSFVSEGGTAVAVHWDTSEAKYAAASPEPCGGEYHLAVVADAELALLLGAGAGVSSRELSSRFGAASPRPRPVLVSRREQLRAPSPSSAEASVAHSTRCRFRDGGAEHEVTVRCRGDRRGEHDGEVAVSVDGKSIVEARRVGWNFRGNRTAVLGDGAVVEVMWDVHDWLFLFAGGVGAAQFMVKARGPGPADGGRVWMDEELASKGQPPGGFFLHMQCYRR